MTETFFAEIVQSHRLGTLTKPPKQVSGGFLHTMVRLDTTTGTYACKLLNPEVMARETAAANFDRAEELEGVLLQNGLPVVTAMVFDGKKRQLHQGQYYYLFHWENGKAHKPGKILPEESLMVAYLLAEIHNIEVKPAPRPVPAAPVDFSSYLPLAAEKNPFVARLLRQFLPMLTDIEEKYNHALSALPEIQCISNGDMDPKNVLWDGGNVCIIDLECLDRANPALHAIQLSLAWAETENGETAIHSFLTFLSTYVRFAHWVKNDTTIDWAALVGLCYGLKDWMLYNLQRALGICTNVLEEQNLGLKQFQHSLHVLWNIYEKESELRTGLAQLKDILPMYPAPSEKEPRKGKKI